MKTIAARKLGVDADTVHAAVKRWPELEVVLAECRESALDLAEDKLIEHIDAGNVTALIFFLKCQGKLRGYIERSELTGPNGAPLLDGVVSVSAAELLQAVRKGGPTE